MDTRRPPSPAPAEVLSSAMLGGLEGHGSCSSPATLHPKAHMCSVKASIPRTLWGTIAGDADRAGLGWALTTNQERAWLRDAVG